MRCWLGGRGHGWSRAGVTAEALRSLSMLVALSLPLGAGMVAAVGTPPAAASDEVAACGGERGLSAGMSLTAGDSLMSPSGRYWLTLQRNGNLVLYGSLGSQDIESPPVTPSALWSSNSAGTRDARLTMRADGDVVLHGAGQQNAPPVWHSRTAGRPGMVLRVCDDGTVTVGSPDGRALWTAGASTPSIGPRGHKHIVYGRSAQRVWLIAADGRLHDTYPVSGRLTNPVPGSYSVYSKSLKTRGLIGQVTMTHMVRFAHGVNGSRIGFHAIPRGADGQPWQTVSQLGEALSAGCVRQQDSKAEQLYGWAPVGTPVIVLD